MKMSVSPKEIAEHLVEELGHQKAMEECEKRINRCYDEKTRGIWQHIGTHLQNRYPI